MIEVTRTYLEMNHPDDFVPVFSSNRLIRIEEITDCSPSFYLYLYNEVGGGYHWIDRHLWAEEQLRTYLADDNVTLWVMYHADSTAGYFELLKGPEGSTEIAYFGLFPDFIGRGLGKHLLSVAVTQAWKDGASRIWLHTCTLDHPSALDNYLKRGFKPFKQETYFTEV